MNVRDTHYPGFFETAGGSFLLGSGLSFLACAVIVWIFVKVAEKIRSGGGALIAAKVAGQTKKPDTPKVE